MTLRHRAIKTRKFERRVRERKVKLIKLNKRDRDDHREPFELVREPHCPNCGRLGNHSVGSEGDFTCMSPWEEQIVKRKACAPIVGVPSRGLNQGAI